MQKYYLFVIQSEYYKIYRKNPSMLYKTLENLYLLESYDLSYGISIFNQLCQPFSVKLLCNYINSKYKCYHINQRVVQMKSLIEKTFLQIGYATVVILTNKKEPEIFKIFNIYNHKIFVCEFDKGDFFWLNQKVSKRVKYSK